MLPISTFLIVNDILGDSGGGFVVRYNNKWYLRGIISSSLQDKDLFTCDTKNFAVFTDIAAYRDWILQYL
jgi:secreted trypsin-like serine protease